MNENKITLDFDDGSSVECEDLGIFDCNGKEYIALDPCDESGDIFLFRYVELSDEECDLQDIEDDAEFEAVAAVFDELFMEE